MYLSSFFIVLIFNSINLIDNEIPGRCTSPEEFRAVVVTTDNSTYVQAVASTLPGFNYEGVEWTVTGGTISYQSGLSISIIPNCGFSTITVCARMYNTDTIGNKCYNSQKCGSVSYSGPCMP